MKDKPFSIYRISSYGVNHWKSLDKCLRYAGDKVMFISRGISGSGKSTAISKIIKKEYTFSTDDFWGPDYNFDRERLDEAHIWNRNRVEEAMKIGNGVGVDNTNLSYFSILPYLDLAEKYNFSVIFVESVLPQWIEFKASKNLEGKEKERISELLDFFAENNSHKVPRDVIKGQAFSYDDEFELAKIMRADIPMKRLQAALRCYHPDAVDINVVIADVLAKATSGNMLADALLELDKIECLRYVFPEIYWLKGFKHNPIFHPEGDAYEHTLSAVRSSRSKDPIVNLAILLHDIGKALTYKNRGTEAEPRHTYYAHEKIGEKMIPIVCKRLGLSKDDCDLIRFTTLNHMHLHSHEYSLNPKSKYLSQHKHWNALKDVGYADEMARGEELANIDKFEERMKNFEKPMVIFAHDDKFTGAILRTAIPEIANEDIGKVMIKLSALTKTSALSFGDIPSCTIQAIRIYKELKEGK